MMTNKHLTEMDVNGSARDIIWVESRHLPGWTAENLDKFQNNRCLGRYLNQISPEYDTSDFPVLHLSASDF
jgi:hypothetical protein